MRTRWLVLGAAVIGSLAGCGSGTSTHVGRAITPSTVRDVLEDAHLVVRPTVDNGRAKQFLAFDRFPHELATVDVFGDANGAARGRAQVMLDHHRQLTSIRVGNVLLWID